MHLPNAAVAVEQKQTWQVLSGMRRAPRRAVPRSWSMGLAALVLGVLGLYVHTVGQEAALNHTQQEIKQLKETNTQLRSQLAGLENPGRVENEAVQKLATGLAMPLPVMSKAEP